MPASGWRSWPSSPMPPASASRSSAAASSISTIPPSPSCSRRPSTARSAPVAAAATGATDLSRRGLWVVKLGGSLHQSRYLRRWLSILAAGGGAVVVVPGGGPFADQVRALQKRRRFDDAAAHHMALLAMEQYGRMLAALEPRLQPAASRADILRAGRAGRAAVWMPTRMVLVDPAIAAGWDITSDSLAAWLAGRLKARRLVLVKSVAVTNGATAVELARRGVVDPAFPAYLRGSGAEGCCIDDAGYRAMARALANGSGPGTPIACDTRARCKPQTRLSPSRKRGSRAGDGAVALDSRFRGIDS